MSDLKEVKNAVVRALARRGYFSSELRQKLIAKGFSEELADEGIRYGMEKGYFDDAHRIRLWIQREFQKGMGLRAVLSKLQQQRLMPLVTEEIHTWMGEEEGRGLVAFLRKKKVGQPLPQVWIRKLLQRGFSYALIKNQSAEWQ